MNTKLRTDQPPKAHTSTRAIETTPRNDFDQEVQRLVESLPKLGPVHGYRQILLAYDGSQATRRTGIVKPLTLPDPRLSQSLPGPEMRRKYYPCR